MRAIALYDQGELQGEEGACPVGSRLEEVVSRRECQEGKRTGKKEWHSCSPWLQAFEVISSGGTHVHDKALLFNLYPGGGEAIQLSAEVAVIQECEKARREWIAGEWDDGGMRWHEGERYGKPASKLAAERGGGEQHVSAEGGGGQQVAEEDAGGALWKARRGERVRVLVHDDMSDYHPFLNPPAGGLVKHCAVPCEFRAFAPGVNVDADEADVVLFLGDLELYRRDPGGRKGLPGTGRAGGGAVRAVAVREALSKFPKAAWSKYDANVTYERGADASYGYVASVDAMLRRASASPGWGERENSVSAVALRCGSGKDSGDRRAMRTRFIEQLGRDVDVRSYGACARNAAWPKGHEKDKAHVTRLSRFCVAYENSADADYVTEKLFDCLAGGAVPIVWGGEHVREFVPPGGGLFVDDFDSVDKLATEVKAIGADAARWDAMRSWIFDRRGEDWERWEKRMQEVEGAGARCRVCELGRWAGERVKVHDGKRRRRYAWEAERIEKEETARRNELADPRLVKLEL